MPCWTPSGASWLLLLLNAASPQRLAQVGKQPVHPISGHSCCLTASDGVADCAHSLKLVAASQRRGKRSDRDQLRDESFTPKICTGGLLDARRRCASRSD